MRTRYSDSRSASPDAERRRAAAPAVLMREKNPQTAKTSWRQPSEKIGAATNIETIPLLYLVQFVNLGVI